MRITVQAQAKINWALDILSRREDGYHEMDMLMQKIALSDEIRFETARWTTLTVNGHLIANAGKNLIVRAANLLNEYMGEKRGVRITLSKHIPVRAGLGGGSADGDQTGPHPGCTVCAVSGSRLCVFLWNGDYHTGISEEDAGKDVQSYAGFADQVF